MYRRYSALAIAGILVAAGGAAGHDIEAHHPTVVIDTDMGLDDAAALALALESPDLDVAAIYASSGACSGAEATRLLERMLARFNRGDVPLYAPTAGAEAQPPPFRKFVETALGDALPDDAPTVHRPFHPAGMTVSGRKVVVLELGPLTNLAAGLRADAELKTRISLIEVAGGPAGWNASFDAAATQAVLASGVPVEFILGDGALKPPGWRDRVRAGGACGSVGAAFLARLLARDEVSAHYFGSFPAFQDEAALMALVARGDFACRQESTALVCAPTAGASVAARFVADLDRGRLRKERIVFTDKALAGDSLQPEIRALREKAFPAFGPNEWFAQLLMNEVHDHLGAYSIIGVKMGLRAAELLNAPPHALRVISHAPATPPSSCLDDGLIVATGSTPGRALFTHEAPEKPAIAAGFEYNGRRLELTLKAERQKEIGERIAALRGQYGIENDAYWTAVRQFGVEVWTTWNRCEIFDARTNGP